MRADASFAVPVKLWALLCAFAGVTIGLTYGKTLAEATQIGTNLAASVITSSENVCPRFLPRELGLDMDPIE